MYKRNVKKMKKKKNIKNKNNIKKNIKELKKKKNLYDIHVSTDLNKKKKIIMTGVIQINHYLVDKHLMLPIKYFMR